MAWTPPANVSTGLASATQFNLETVENLRYLKDRVDSGVMTITGSDTGLTVGNGDRTRIWTRVADLVWMEWRLQVGSTTSLSGVLTIRLPVAAAGITLLQARLIDTGARHYIGNALGWGGSTVQVSHSESGGGGQATSSAPFTWASGDFIIVTGTYRAA